MALWPHLLLGTGPVNYCPEMMVTLAEEDVVVDLTAVLFWLVVAQVEHQPRQMK